MDYATVIDQAVKQFYAEGNNDVHSWLLRVQASPEAWTFVWELLDPSKVHKYTAFSMYHQYIIRTTSFVFYYSQEKHSFTQPVRCTQKFPNNGMKCPRVNIQFYRNV